MRASRIRPDGGLLFRGGGLLSPGGGLVRVPTPGGVSLIADLDFSAPVVQAFGSANATHQYLLQETSGNYADTGTGATADINAFTAGLQGQSRPGIWNGTSYTALKAWETDGATARAAVSNVGVFDSNNSDLYFRIEFAILGTPAAASVLTEKRNAAAAGWTAEVQTDGTIDVIIEDASANTVTVSLVGNHCEGAPHYLEFFYDDSADELTVNSDLDLGNVATDTAAVTGSLTNTVAWRLGDPDSGITAARFQTFLAEGAEGSAAATMFAETGWWTHGTSPAPLTTLARLSAISVPVGTGAVSHFAPDTLPIGYHAAFSDTDKLGLYCNSAVTNLVPYSELSTGATNTNATPTDNAEDSPDGFRSATSLIADANAGFQEKVCVVTAGLEYTGAIYIKESTAGVQGRVVAYDLTNGAEIDATPYTGTGTAVDVPITFTTPALCVSVGLRCEITTSGETVIPTFWQLNLGTGRGAIIRTSGTAAALVASDYQAAGNLVQETAGEVRSVAVSSTEAFPKYLYFTTGGNNDRRSANLATESGRINSRVNDGSGGVQYSATDGDTHAIETEIDHRLIWDESSTGVDGFKAVVVDVDHDTRNNGAASPWSAPSGGGFNGTVIGQDNVAMNQFDGFIQSIKSYDGQNGVLP